MLAARRLRMAASWSAPVSPPGPRSRQVAPSGGGGQQQTRRRRPRPCLPALRPCRCTATLLGMRPTAPSMLRPAPAPLHPPWLPLLLCLLGLLLGLAGGVQAMADETIADLRYSRALALALPAEPAEPASP